MVRRALTKGRQLEAKFVRVHYANAFFKHRIGLCSYPTSELGGTCCPKPFAMETLIRKCRASLIPGEIMLLRLRWALSLLLRLANLVYCCRAQKSYLKTLANNPR